MATGLRVGIDLDGVVYDFVTWVLYHWNNEFKTDFCSEQITDYNIWKILGVDREVFLRWYRGRGEKKGNFLSDLPLRYHDVGTFLTCLYEFTDEYSNVKYQNEIVIITSRDPSVFGEDTIRSLQADNIKYHELHFCEKKWKVDCDVYIDDNPYLLNTFNKLGKDLVIPSRPWTKHVFGTFSSYDSILRHIQQKIQGGYCAN